MKGRPLPHIILRFSRPPVAADSPSNYDYPEDSPPEADKQIDGRDEKMATTTTAATVRTRSSRHKKQRVGLDAPVTETPTRGTLPAPVGEQEPTTPVSTGKRKREIPKSIGGGKGDLKPPSRRSGKGSPAVTTPGSEKGGEKRVLRSQDTTKKSEYEEWFETRKDECEDPD